MEKKYIFEKSFDKIDFTENKLEFGEYENCTFSNCNFSNADLTNIVFTESEFVDCNFSSAKLFSTAFRDIVFKGCKLLGLQFDNCNEFLFLVNFDACNLNLSSFYGMKMKNTHFKNTTLHEVDFTETDLTNSLFHNCDLLKAIFDNTILEKADLRTALNYSIDPESNRIKKAKFSMEGVIGLLNKYDILIE